ncbi:kinase-like domain-containing protein [Paraphysoderma sedebokerense]|nr:kinase-like domain-containing protein [Paraphysoderma sedebokerense]
MAASEKDAYPSDTSADINLSLPTSDAEEHIPYYEGLEDYKLIRKMGEGAFSIVYWAVNIRTNEEVAVKVVRKKDLTPIQVGLLVPTLTVCFFILQRANILKELRIHSALSHPHIVRLLGHKETPEYYFLFLEGCRGGEVFNKIVDLTCFSEDLSRWVITQVGEAVRYLHEEVGVVHRDIKPENLLFLPIPMNEKTSSFRTSSDSKEGTFIPNVGGGGIGVVKLCDFGLSKVIWDEMTKTPCGTDILFALGYTAPEIVLHPPGGHSKSVDMWAIGCVLYTMLCGFPPFYDDDPNVLTEKVAKGHWEFLTPWWDPISAGAKDLVKHLLTVNPSERYTIDEFFQHPW